MTDTLEYVQNQDYEGIMAHFEKTIDGVVSDLDISGASEITFRVFNRDLTLQFSGTKTGGQVQFYTDGTDGKPVFAPGATDMATVGKYRGECEVILGGKSLKKQGLIVNIEPESETS